MQVPVEQRQRLRAILGDVNLPAFLAKRVGHVMRRIGSSSAMRSRWPQSVMTVPPRSAWGVAQGAASPGSVAPFPTWLSTSMVPPWAATML